jgi:4-nitrophenyl phosphatase
LDLTFLGSISLLISDMDGTIYLGNRIFPYTKEFFSLISEKNIDYILFTNNASKSSEDYIRKLDGMSLHVHRNNILTSGDVTAEFLRSERSGKTVYLVGTQSLTDTFNDYGIKIVPNDPDIVVVSFDTTLTYGKLDKACRFIRNGAEFISTHCDLNCPTEDGWMPDSGSICSLITASTGKTPRYFGKPYPETVAMIENITGYDRSQMAIIGDRLYTDIKMGINSGIKTILVLSGETKRSDLAASDIKPDLVYDDLGCFMEDIRKL